MVHTELHQGIHDHERNYAQINKPKGLKVAKEVLMSIGSMVDRLDD